MQSVLSTLPVQSEEMTKVWFRPERAKVGETLRVRQVDGNTTMFATEDFEYSKQIVVAPYDKVFVCNIPQIIMDAYGIKSDGLACIIPLDPNIYPYILSREVLALDFITGNNKKSSLVPWSMFSRTNAKFTVEKIELSNKYMLRMLKS